MIKKQSNFLKFIPELKNGEINPEFPVISISNKEKLKTRLNEINIRNDNNYTEDENKKFNLDNKFTDDLNNVFDLFKVNSYGERIPLFRFNKNNELIVKQPRINNTELPYLPKEIQQHIIEFVGGK